jgi:hypothetical protein
LSVAVVTMLCGCGTVPGRGGSRWGAIGCGSIPFFAILIKALTQ